ncbi:MAG: biotin--[acetyl-CoA-carboxylase] ligase [Gaiellaceae bacterium]
MRDLLTAAEVEPLLRGRFGRPYLFVTRCASTQLLLPADAAEGAVAASDEQTAGRGRLGRRWVAEPATSLLCSIVLRPTVEPARLPELSLVAGEAAAEAIAAVTGLRPVVKFPNDVLIGGRKTAGILAEAVEGRVTLGFGVNVNVPEAGLPREVTTPATSLLVETGSPVSRSKLLVALLELLEHRYDAWVAGADPAP